MQTSTLRRLRLGEENKRRKKKNNNERQDENTINKRRKKKNNNERQDENTINSIPFTSRSEIRSVLASNKVTFE